MGFKARENYARARDREGLRQEMQRYSENNVYAIQQCIDHTCACGASLFLLAVDDSEGVAETACIACKALKPVADSGEFAEDASLEQCECVCGGDVFEVTVGVALYAESDDVRWIYVGARCVKCDIAGVYCDWKCDGGNYRTMLGGGN